VVGTETDQTVALERVGEGVKILKGESQSKSENGREKSKPWKSERETEK
jgi:hypothetical protein